MAFKILYDIQSLLVNNNMIPAFPHLGIFFTVITLLLGIFVFYGSAIQKSIEKYVVYFIVSTVFSALWILTNTVLLPLEVVNLDHLVSISFSSSIVMILSIWRLAISFNKQAPSAVIRAVDLILTILGIMFFTLSLSSRLIIRSTAQTSERLTLEFGLMYEAFSLYFVTVFIIIAYKLFKEYRGAVGKAKSQLFYFVVGFYLTAVVSVLSNLLLPFYTGDSSSSRIGPFAILFFLVCSTYAITRYQFLNIRVLVGRVVYYFTIALMFWVIYYLTYYFDKVLFGGSDTTYGIISGIFVACLFAVIFIKFTEYLRVQVRSKIINPGYDPLEINEQLSRRLAPILDIRAITYITEEMIESTIRPDYTIIVINTRKENKTRVINYSKYKKSNIVLQSKLDCIYQLWRGVGVQTLLVENINSIKVNSTPDSSSNIHRIYSYMIDKNIRAIVPIKQNAMPVGALLLGKKQGDSIYTLEDVEFLEGLATTTGLAVTRAYYYLEVQDLNKNLQKRINIATEELQQKNRALEESLNKIEEIRRQERDMIDVMGHELRTPITIVRNALLVLKSKLDSKEKLTQKELLEYIDKAVEGSRREVNLVETLLSATKVESNRIQLLLTKVDMKDVVMDSIDAHKVYIKDKNIKIKFNAPSRDIFAYADRSRTQEVMDNFLSNAVKYTIKGGITINLIKDANHVSVALTDTGIGIAKQDIKHLGKKFFRAKQYLDSTDGKTNGVVRPGGTGLGLYVSFNLIRIMKGKVEIESQLGKGSIFTFKLPVYKRQEDKHIDQSFSE